MIENSKQQADDFDTRSTEPAHVPAEQRFDLAGGSDTEPKDYMEAADLEEIVDYFIGTFDEFVMLKQAEVTTRCLWKREGGKSKGRNVLGKVVKTGGLVAHYADCDFVIWLAADHVRELCLSKHQLQALVFGELLQCTVNVKADGSSVFALVDHDFRFFDREIARFGLWREDLKLAHHSCSQRSLFSEQEKTT